jgi:hypothetical protein
LKLLAQFENLGLVGNNNQLDEIEAHRIEVGSSGEEEINEEFNTENI